jgi:hypothetical protein
MLLIYGVLLNVGGLLLIFSGAFWYMYHSIETRLVPSFFRVFRFVSSFDSTEQAQEVAQSLRHRFLRSSFV